MILTGLTPCGGFIAERMRLQKGGEEAMAKYTFIHLLSLRGLTFCRRIKS
jgi:hypothetical protein